MTAAIAVIALTLGARMHAMPNPGGPGTMMLSRLAQGPMPIVVTGTAPAGEPDAIETELILNIGGEVEQPFDLVRVVRRRDRPGWLLAERRRILAVDRHLTLKAVPGPDTLIFLFAAGSPGYLMVGPLRWPDRASGIDVPLVWRRTVRGNWPNGESLQPTWIAADPPASASGPLCDAPQRGAFECVGVPVPAAGVVLGRGVQGVMFATSPGASTALGVEEVSATGASWGRLLVIRRADGAAAAPADAISVAGRRLQVPRARQLPSRAHTESEPRIRVDRLALAAFWVSGAVVPPGAWLEVTGAGLAPARLDVSIFAAAPADLVEQALLEPSAVLAGRVIDEKSRPASGVNVTIYRLIADPRTDRTRPSRRVMVGEATSDADGAFQFRGLGHEPHELLAIHFALGRAEGALETGASSVELVLRAPSRVTGRVIRDGVPVAGARVATVPDLIEFARIDDVTELAGGESETDADGRFVVSMPVRGRVELRIGSAATGVRRLVLGDVNTLPQLVDAGTIELAPAAPLTLVLEDSAACELVLAGPLGRSGVIVHRATRLGPSLFRATPPEPGTWLVSATCGGRARDVSPSYLEAAADGPERTVNLAWR